MKYTNKTGYTMDIQINAKVNGEYIEDVTLQDGESIEISDANYPNLNESPVYCQCSNCRTYEDDGNIYHEGN